MRRGPRRCARRRAAARWSTSFATCRSSTSSRSTTSPSATTCRRSRFAGDLGLWILEPMGRGWAEALKKRTPAGDARDLRRAVGSGAAAALFLKRPPEVFEGKTRGKVQGDDGLRTLLDLQRTMDTPILLVPQVFVWSRHADEAQRGAVDVLFGPREWPGKLRTVAQFAMNYRQVSLRAGEPLDLKHFIASEAREEEETHRPHDEERLVRRITYTLLRRLERQRHAILGPDQEARRSPARGGHSQPQAAEDHLRHGRRRRAGAAGDDLARARHAPRDGSGARPERHRRDGRGGERHGGADLLVRRRSTRKGSRGFARRPRTARWSSSRATNRTSITSCWRASSSGGRCRCRSSPPATTSTSFRSGRCCVAPAPSTFAAASTATGSTRRSSMLTCAAC